MQEFKGLKIYTEGNSIMVHGVRDFDPVHTFECGQCFRWNRLEDGSFFGVAGGKAVEISYSDNVLTIKNSTFKDFAEFWYEYLDLGRDYSKIKSILSSDPIIKTAIQFFGGIKKLKKKIN